MKQSIEEDAIRILIMPIFVVRDIYSLRSLALLTSLLLLRKGFEQPII